MNLFGFEITRRKAVASVSPPPVSLTSPSTRGWFQILESYAGAWQDNVEVTVANVTTHPTLFACVTLIASTVAKMRMRLVQERDEVWIPVEVPAFSPVLRTPNHYQTPQQFYECWVLSKLLAGNTYTLKIRDRRQTVTAMHVLDPNRVRPLVAPNGDVFYQLGRDDLSQLPEAAGYIVPASEIIHDRWNCLFHPLVGLSPIYACGVAAVQGLNIQNNSTNFFANGALPGGVLTAPGDIAQLDADSIKADYEANFTGDNAGKLLLVSGGMKFEALAMTAVDSELVEQLKWTDEKIGACYHVPLFLVSSSTYPPYAHVESSMTIFYSMCIQAIAEAIERCLDVGFGLTVGDVAAQRYGTEFDRNDLFTMDLSTLMETLEKGKNYLTPDEGRRKLNLPPTIGGGVVYRQQQDFSLEALAKRDAQADPFGTADAAPEPPEPEEAEPEDAETKLLALRYRAQALAHKSIEAAL